MKRTDYCGKFKESHVGQTVTAMGWVSTKRDMGGVIFVDLRDREGFLQVVFNLESIGSKQFALAESLRNEWVIAVTGTMYLREEETYNPNIETGTIELRASHLEILSEAGQLPFEIEGSLFLREDRRLKYRYLDIRRPAMLRNLKFRHRLQAAIQNYLDEKGFIFVETPILTKSTPEGARDYLVPSRVHPGSFYALPQSPQIFKQLLMVGGVDRYYQVARCFRDEDLRADRQPEFTQVDLELSFVDQEDVLTVLEGVFRHVMKKAMNMELTKPFPRLTWQEAMDRYGSDKPDLRFDLPIVDISPIAADCSFSVFRSVIDQGGVVRAINVTGGADFSRTVIEDLTAQALSAGAKGMAWIALRPDGEVYSILTKYLKEEEINQILKAVEAKPGDFILFCADTLPTVRKTLGHMRLVLADLLKLRRKDQFEFLIVTDFPQFEYSPEEKRYIATHHPFTMPYEEDIPYLLSDPGRVRAQAYDFVLNGVELGSGSIRIHRSDVQKIMFEALGFSAEEIQERFGFFIKAFGFGTPPHGGFAFGLDRLAMLLLGADSLREVIAFPKTKDASCLLTDAPNRVDQEQIQVLGISLGDSVNTAHHFETQIKEEIDVDQVAELSKLKLNDKERGKIKEELSAIIGFANRLSELDTKDVPITAHVLPIQNVLREDVAKKSFDRDILLSNGPAVEDGYFFVPKVVEEGGE